MTHDKFGVLNIRVGVVGHVLNGDHSGHVVRIENDNASTGGFLVFERWDGHQGPNHDGWFDSWVEDEAALRRFFDSAGWEVRWSETA